MFQILSLLIVVCFCLARLAAAATDASLAFTHVNVIDVTGGPTQTDMTVIVAGQRIVAVGKSADVRTPRAAKVVAATGKYLIPDLWDMHVHIVFGDWIPPDEKVTLLLFVANGITGVRDMGGDLERNSGVQPSQLGS